MAERDKHGGVATASADKSNVHHPQPFHDFKDVLSGLRGYKLVVIFYSRECRAYRPEGGYNLASMSPLTREKGSKRGNQYKTQTVDEGLVGAGAVAQQLHRIVGSGVSAEFAIQPGNGAHSHSDICTFRRSLLLYRIDALTVQVTAIENDLESLLRRGPLSSAGGLLRRSISSSPLQCATYAVSRIIVRRVIIERVIEGDGVVRRRDEVSMVFCDAGPARGESAIDPSSLDSTFLRPRPRSLRYNSYHLSKACKVIWLFFFIFGRLFAATLTHTHPHDLLES